MADKKTEKKAAEAPTKDASGFESICLDDYLIPGDVNPWDVEVCYVYVPD